MVSNVATRLPTQSDDEPMEDVVHSNVDEKGADEEGMVRLLLPKLSDNAATKSSSIFGLDQHK